MSERPVTGDERTRELIARFAGLYEKDRVAAAIEAASLGSPAILPLADALRHPHPFVREQAALALGKIGPSASAAIPDLIESLGDEAPYVREKAAAALGALGPAAKAAIPRLIRLVGEDFGLVCEASALAVAAIGPAAVAPLIGLLGHEGGTARGYAALALGEVGPAAAPAVPDLIGLLEDPYRFAWLSSVKSLGQIGPAAKAAITGLIGVLASDDAKGRALACQALIAIGPASVPALLDSAPAGIDCRWELDGYLRVWSRDLPCGIIQAIGPRALPDLIQALAGGEPASSRAWEALSTWDEEVEPYLKDAVRDPNLVVRTKAEVLLAKRRAAALVEVPLSELRHRFSQAHDVLLVLLTTAKTATKTKEELRTFRTLVKLRSFRKVAIEEARLLGRDGDHSGPATRIGRLAKSLGAPLTRTVAGDGRKRIELTDLGGALGEWIEANPNWLD